MMPPKAISEAAMSAAGIPGMAGWPSLPRFTLRTPDSASTARSCAGRSGRGPLCPKAESDAYTIRGFRADTAA